VAENELVAEVREVSGKGASRRLRTEGRIPAVLYSRGRDTRGLVLETKALVQLLRESEAGINTLIDLRIQGGEGGDRVVLVKELQRDPVEGALLHADLYEVDLTHTIQVSVPIELVGEPVGVRMSAGILDHTLREIEIECLPRAIPDELQIDVSNLEIGDSVHVRDIQLPEGVELRTDPDLGVAAVIPPTVEEVAPTAEEAVEEEAAAGEAPEGEDAGEAPTESKSKPDEE
jgi:large subunit ribosomal protein L25